MSYSDRVAREERMEVVMFWNKKITTKPYFKEVEMLLEFGYVEFEVEFLDGKKFHIKVNTQSPEIIYEDDLYLFSLSYITIKTLYDTIGLREEVIFLNNKQNPTELYVGKLLSIKKVGETSDKRLVGVMCRT